MRDSFGGKIVTHSQIENENWYGLSPRFIDLPRTFVVISNDTKERHYAFEVEDIVRQTDSVTWVAIATGCVHPAVPSAMAAVCWLTVGRMACSCLTQLARRSGNPPQ